jgi:hypothetical protein
MLLILSIIQNHGSLEKHAQTRTNKPPMLNILNKFFKMNINSFDELTDFKGFVANNCLGCCFVTFYDKKG